jgi:hypothetical protein
MEFPGVRMEDAQARPGGLSLLNLPQTEVLEKIL